ncbi:MAG: type II secretion system protein [Minisyncoccota bacterium]
MENHKRFLNSQSGFTLIESVAVISVLAITSVILIVNNRLNELQLSISKDSALIASTVSRAKSLALQNSVGTEGYGVRFNPVGVDKDSFFIYKDKDLDGYTQGDEILDTELRLSSGVLFYNPSKASDSIIKDLVFYSSDANVKIFNSSGSLIPDAGIIIVQTNTVITPASNTLKITITGQVTSKAGVYLSSVYFDEGVTESELSDGSVDAGDIGDGNLVNNDESIVIFYTDDCTPNCTGKCNGESDSCGGVCACPSSYSCSQGSCMIVSEFCTGKTCNDTDPATGKKCISCSGSDICQLVSGVYQCTPITCDPVSSCIGKCGGDDGCGGTCPNNCVLPETCGGSGISDVCGCTPTCLGKNVGDSDGCGGICHKACTNNMCILATGTETSVACTLNDPCVCIPKTKIEACGTWTCGTVGDGCGNTINCGDCISPDTCQLESGVYKCVAPICTCPVEGDPDYLKCTVKDSCGTDFCHICDPVTEGVCNQSTGFCEIEVPLIIESIDPPTFTK